MANSNENSRMMKTETLATSYLREYHRVTSVTDSVTKMVHFCFIKFVSFVGHNHMVIIKFRLHFWSRTCIFYLNINNSIIFDDLMMQCHQFYPNILTIFVIVFDSIDYLVNQGPPESGRPTRMTTAAVERHVHSKL